jgi:trk system potassium uptake protein TrkA
VLILVGTKVRSNAPIINQKLEDVFFHEEKMRIVAIKRNSVTIIPKGSDEIKANDIVYFMTTKEDIPYLREQAGKEEIDIKNVMIMGGSRICLKTCKYLPDNMKVKIVEKDKEKAYSVLEQLSDTLVINGDGRDLELLKEEGIQHMDAFVAVTGNSEANILACLAAKRYGVKKTIAEVENIDYISLAENLDIGTIINKKLIAASHIYQLTLDADVTEIKCLTNVDVDVIEFLAKPDSKITKDKVKDLKLPRDLNIGGIVRNGVGIIVNGETQIEADDHVIVFCYASKIRKIEKYFN